MLRLVLRAGWGCKVLLHRGAKGPGRWVVDLKPQTWGWDRRAGLRVKGHTANPTHPALHEMTSLLRVFVLNHGAQTYGDFVAGRSRPRISRCPAVLFRLGSRSNSQRNWVRTSLFRNGTQGGLWSSGALSNERLGRVSENCPFSARGSRASSN